MIDETDGSDEAANTTPSRTDQGLPLGVEPLVLRVDAQDVLVHGTRREDHLAHSALRQAGFAWSRPRQAWVLRRNLRPDTRARAINEVAQALTGLGRDLVVDDTGRIETAESRRDAARTRLSARAANHFRGAAHAQDSSDQNRHRAELIWTGYAGGPVLTDHYSSTRHQNDLDRADRAMRAALEQQDDAAEHRRLAEQIHAHLESGDHPITLKQRLDTKERALRSTRRALTGNPGTQRMAELQAAADLLADEIALDQKVLADLVARGVTRNWGPLDFRPGDTVYFNSTRGYEVTGVNPRTLRVATRPGTSRTAPYLTVTARTRDGLTQTAADLHDLEAN